MGRNHSLAKSAGPLALLTLLAVGLVRPAYPALSSVMEWVARYNGPGNFHDSVTAMAADGLGNVYVTGYSQGTGNDYATVKYNSSGVQQWVARYNGPANSTDQAVDVAVDGNGNVYVTGYAANVGTGSDFATVKYNSNGVQQWVALYNGPANSADLATKIAVDASGNVYVIGASPGTSSFDDDYATVKYNSAGVQQWARRYNGPVSGRDGARALTLDGSGNVYVTGNSSGDSTTGSDYATLKYNSSGVQQWVVRYTGSGNNSDTGNAIALDGAGNVYVTGNSYGGTATNTNYATVKYTNSGTQLWATQYNGPASGSDGAMALAVDASGNAYVTGFSAGPGTANDYATVKYDSAGMEQWAARYNGPANTNDNGRSVALGSDGSVYVTGDSQGGPATLNDFATIKYAPNGAQQWVARYNHTANSNDQGVDLAVDGSGNVYVAGSSYSGPATATDFATVKYSQAVVNDPPVVQPNKTVTLAEDALNTSLALTAPTDADGDPLTVTVTAVPDSTKGYVRRAGNGAVVAVTQTLTVSELLGLEFAPAANANGDAGVFQYTVTDGQGGSASQTVTLTITPVNDAPVAQPNSYGIDQGGTLEVAAPGVLGNDTDVENQTLSAVQVTAPANGALTLFGDGGFLYQPNPGYSGPDSFTYLARDAGNADSASVTVTLTVRATAADTTPPNATVGAVVTESSSRVYVPISITDSGSGLAQVKLTRNSTNCKLEWDGPAGLVSVPINGVVTINPALASTSVRVVKLATSQRSRVEVQVWDAAGNTAVYDPVIANLELKRKQIVQNYQKLPSAEHYITLQNGTPGLEKLKLVVNGRVLFQGAVTDGQVLRLDAAEWMRAGNRNTVRLVASGPAGGTAVLLIGDASLAGSAKAQGPRRAGRRYLLELPR